MIKKILLSILALITLLVILVIVRTVTFRSDPLAVEKVEPIDVPEIAITRFKEALTYETISYFEEEQRDTTEFLRFHQFLSDSYPMVDSLLEKKIFNYSILYKWEGKDESKKGIVLMGHFTMDKWEALPFSGDLKDGKIFGRGAMDDKVNVISWMETIEILMNEGYQPEQTIFFSFGHDEEVGGDNGARLVAEYLEAQGEEIAFVLDEGGFIAESGMIEGLGKPLAMINTAEKGYVSYRLKINTPGGHSSAPPTDNTIGSLARAIVILEENQFDYEMVPLLETQISKIGPHLSDFKAKIAFANTWLFGKTIIKGLNAHTTTAPTMISGGVKDNVIPTEASVVVNFRIMPGETADNVKEHIVKLINDDRISVEVLKQSTEPSPFSDTNSDAYKLIEQTIYQLFPDIVVSPGLLGGGTDSKHFQSVADNVYRFYPTRINPENMGGLHGNNEHIPVSNYFETIQFNYQLMKNLQEF
jgi:carboxypeptidase PM20D1